MECTLFWMAEILCLSAVKNATKCHHTKPCKLLIVVDMIVHNPTLIGDWHFLFWSSVHVSILHTVKARWLLQRVGFKDFELRESSTAEMDLQEFGFLMFPFSITSDRNRLALMNENEGVDSEPTEAKLKTPLLPYEL